jgi:hypothetical protein
MTSSWFRKYDATLRGVRILDRKPDTAGIAHGATAGQLSY